MCPKGLTPAERKDKKEMQKAVGHTLSKESFREYATILGERGLSVKEACKDTYEVAYMQLFLSLTDPGKNTAS